MVMNEKIPDDEKETPPGFDPLLAQAEQLPAFLRGTGGGMGDHVRPAGADGEEVEEPMPEDEDAFDEQPREGGGLTADDL